MGKLTLRADVAIGSLEKSHAADMLAWMQDSEISGNIGLTRSPTMEATEAWIASALSGTSTWPYAIFHAGAHVGNVVLDQRDTHLGSARLSVYIGPATSRGRGVGVTGMYLALRDAFASRGLHKVWLTVHARNGRAICAYTRLGFQVEGVLRDGFLLAGERVPALYMGLLRGDFLALQTETV